VPITALKKATIETLGITPRRDGKVEIVLRVLADHERLTECAAKFIRAGCESFRLLDVFKAIAPTDEHDIFLRSKAPDVRPDVPALDSERSVSVSGAVDVHDVGDMSAERPPSNDNALAELRRAANSRCFSCAHAPSCEQYEPIAC
jgi:hypothetical protein